MQQNMLICVDGNNILRRMDATNDMRFEGMKTGGIKGTLSRCHMLQHTYQPSNFALVFDGVKYPTFRHELYSDYKGNRETLKTTDPMLWNSIQLQKNYLIKIANHYGWPCFVSERVEADDVIGTLAVNFPGQVIIDSNDKDFAQLVNERIRVLQRIEKTDHLLDAEGVLGRYGVPPELVINYLMMVGDHVDNVPGIKGVDHKTALMYLRRYKSLRRMWECRDDLTPAIYRNLVAAEEHFPLTKKLLTIKTDVEEVLHADTLLRTPDTESLYPLLRSVGMEAEVAYIKANKFYQPKWSSQ